jgi:hypothetical protein
MTSPDIQKALREYGLRYDVSRSLWFGLDFELTDEVLDDLSLSDIDQITAALRDGLDSVRLGPDKIFRFQ